MKVLEVEALRVAYRDTPILHGIDLSVDAGEIIGIIGPNGSGKTTFLNALTGMLDFTGTIRWFDREIGSHLPPDSGLKQLIAYQPDLLTPMPYTTVHDYLKFFVLASRKYSALDIDRVVARYCDIFWLTEAKDKLLGEISRGTKQRLAFASLLAQRPSVLILDEPTSGLDVEGVGQARRILSRLTKMGRTVIIATHQLSELENLATRVFVLTQGRLRGISLPGLSSPDEPVKYLVRLASSLNSVEALERLGLDITEHGDDHVVISLPVSVSLNMAIARFTDAGMRVIDTSRLYGSLEERYLEELL